MTSKNLNNSSVINTLEDIKSKLMASDFDLNEYMDLVCTEMQKITPATGVIIELVDGDDLVYRAASGTAKNFLGLRLAINKSISGLCVNERKVLLSPETETDERVNLEACRKVSARSLVVAPLLSANKAVGVIKVMADYPNAFNDEHIKILEMMAGFLATAISRSIMAEIRNFF